MPRLPDELRPEVGQVEHRPDCPGPRIIRRDGTRVAVISCTACGRWVNIPRRSEWRDTPQPKEHHD